MSILKPKTKTNINRIEKIQNGLKVFKNLNISIEEGLLSTFKSKTASQKTTMTNVIIKAIEDYIK